MKIITNLNLKMILMTMCMILMKSCLKTIETNKAESKNATQDKVEDFNEDTCDVCAYDFKTFQYLLTHNHSHDKINNHNDDKTVYVENEVESDNATENNV